MWNNRIIKMETNMIDKMDIGFAYKIWGSGGHVKEKHFHSP